MDIVDTECCALKHFLIDFNEYDNGLKVKDVKFFLKNTVESDYDSGSFTCLFLILTPEEAGDKNIKLLKSLGFVHMHNFKRRSIYGDEPLQYWLLDMDDYKF